MRLRLRNELRLGLSPDRLVTVGYRRGLRNSIYERSIEELGAPAAGPPWQSAVEALSRAVASDRGRLSDAVVVLSNHFARYAVLPWTPALKTEADWLAYAKHTLAATYGAEAAGWEVRLCCSGRGKARIACGIDAELIAAISATVREAGARLRSIQPYLAVVFNRLRKSIDREGACIALQEAGRLTLCIVGAKGLSAVRSRRTHGDGIAALARLLAHERVFAEEAGGPRRVLICTDEPLELASEPRQGAVRLEDRTLGRGDPPDLRRYALALA